MNILSAIHRELLARRIGRVLAAVPGTVHAKEVADTPNQRHASFAVLRAARLVSVGNWLAHKAQGRLAQPLTSKSFRAAQAKYDWGRAQKMLGRGS